MFDGVVVAAVVVTDAEAIGVGLETVTDPDPKPVEAAGGWNGLKAGLAGVEAAKGVWPPNPNPGFEAAAAACSKGGGGFAAAADGCCWGIVGATLGRSTVPILMPAADVKGWAGLVT